MGMGVSESRFRHFCQARRLNHVEGPSGFEGCGAPLQPPMGRVRSRLVRGSVGAGGRGIGAPCAAGALRVGRSSLPLRPAPGEGVRTQTPNGHAWPSRGPHLPSRSLSVQTQLNLDGGQEPLSVLPFLSRPSAFPPCPREPLSQAAEVPRGPQFPRPGPGAGAAPSPALLRVRAHPAARLLHAACLRPARAALTLTASPPRENFTALWPYVTFSTTGKERKGTME